MIRLTNQLPHAAADFLRSSLRARVVPALAAGALGLLALGATGCYARAVGGAAVVYDEPVVEVGTVPVYVESYPRYYYRGSYAYLVDGVWYYRSGARWVTFRAEPRVLATVRVSYEKKYGRHYRPRPDLASPPPGHRPRPHDRGHDRD